MKLPLNSDGQQLRTVAKYSEDVVKLPFNPNGQQLNIVRLAHASSLGSWGGRKRRGCSERAGALLKGMEQQLYGNKGEATGPRDTNSHFTFICICVTPLSCIGKGWCGRQDEPHINKRWCKLGAALKARFCLVLQLWMRQWFQQQRRFFELHVFKCDYIISMGFPL